MNRTQPSKTKKPISNVQPLNVKPLLKTDQESYEELKKKFNNFQVIVKEKDDYLSKRENYIKELEKQLQDQKKEIAELEEKKNQDSDDFPDEIPDDEEIEKKRKREKSEFMDIFYQKRFKEIFILTASPNKELSEKFHQILRNILIEHHSPLKFMELFKSYIKECCENNNIELLSGTLTFYTDLLENKNEFRNNKSLKNEYLLCEIQNNDSQGNIKENYSETINYLFEWSLNYPDLFVNILNLIDLLFVNCDFKLFLNLSKINNLFIQKIIIKWILKLLKNNKLYQYFIENKLFESLLIWIPLKSYDKELLILILNLFIFISIQYSPPNEEIQGVLQNFDSTQDEDISKLINQLFQFA